MSILTIIWISSPADDGCKRVAVQAAPVPAGNVKVKTVVWLALGVDVIWR
jgi:hypothetical protein